MQLPRLSLLDFEFPNSNSKQPLQIPLQTQQQQHHLNGQSTASPIAFTDIHSQHNSQHRSIPIPVPLRSNQTVTNEYNNTFSVAQSVPISSQSTLISHSSSNNSDWNGSIAASLPTSLVATGKAKKTRTRTTKEQARELQKIFDLNPLPNMKQRQELGNLIGMTPRAVQVWFQNKRQNMKKLQIPLAAAAETAKIYSDETSSRPPSPIEDLAAIALLGISTFNNKV